MDGGRTHDDSSDIGPDDATPPTGTPFPAGTPVPPATGDVGRGAAADRADIWDVGTAPPVVTPVGDPLDPDTWPPLGTPTARQRRATDPALPHAPAKPPPPMHDPFRRTAPVSTAWYRTDEDRNRSVYRLANPWYRRLARGVIATLLLSAAGLGVYVGVRAVQQYVERNDLPEAGVEVPTIRATSFLLDAAAPAPELVGTLTMDATTGAFEFVGRPGGPQAGSHVVSTDGTNVYVRDGATWRAATTAADTVAGDAARAAGYLADDLNADAILTDRIRRGYVELVDRVEEGTGVDQLTRYELRIDTSAMAVDVPVQWQQYRESAIPGVAESSALPVTIWVDRSGVLVRVSEGNWAWQRLTYSDQPFRVAPPGGATEVTCDADGIVWETALDSCGDAVRIGRDLAVAAGFDPDDATAADRAVAEACAAMAIGAGPLPASEETASLAGALVARGVCAGDPTIFVAGGG